MILMVLCGVVIIVASSVEGLTATGGGFKAHLAPVAGGSLMLIGGIVAAWDGKTLRLTCLDPASASWRPMVAVCGALLTFIAVFHLAGLFPGSVAAGFLAGLAFEDGKVGRALLIAIVTGAFATLLVSYGLQMSAPVIQIP